MDEDNLPDLKGKVIALYLASPPPVLSAGIVFEYASFLRQGGRLFVVGRAPEFAVHNAEWTGNLQGGVPWDAVIHYLLFDSHDDYVRRCQTWKPPLWRRFSDERRFNKSPEPTPVGAGCSASRSMVFRPAWPSYFCSVAG